MKRRNFLFGAGAATLAGCSGSPSASGEAPAISTGKKVRWRVASSFPRSLDTIYGGAEVLAERVSAMTDGNFEIRAYPAGELVPGLQVLDAVQNGTCQVAFPSSVPVAKESIPISSLTCQVGFMKRT